MNFFLSILVLLTVCCSVSQCFARLSNDKHKSAIVYPQEKEIELSHAQDSEEDSSDDSESDEDYEGIELGPEENPKCEHSSQYVIKYPTCAGTKQSPININATFVQLEYKTVSPLCWRNYDAIPITQNLINKGHTIQMQATWRTGETPSISCGVLGDASYEFVQWHCHWAKNNRNGSEHTFNKVTFPMECHFVHFKKEFGTFQNAALQKDGLAVVAYIFDVKNNDSFPADVMGGALVRLVKEDNVSVMPLPLGVYGKQFGDNYVTYHGSLTTPPCSESVIWIIHIKSQNISKSLMRKFRHVAQASECLTNNFRTPQHLNGRDVYLVPDNSKYSLV